MESQVWTKMEALDSEGEGPLVKLGHPMKTGAVTSAS